MTTWKDFPLPLICFGRKSNKENEKTLHKKKNPIFHGILFLLENDKRKIYSNGLNESSVPASSTK